MLIALGWLLIAYSISLQQVYVATATATNTTEMTPKPSFHPTFKPFQGTATAIHQFSNFLFLGDSVMMRWASFAEGSNVAYLLTYEQYIYIYKYFDSPPNLLVDCNKDNNRYCQTAFSHAFRGAMNFGAGGAPIESMTKRVLTSYSINAMSTNLYPHNEIVNVVVLAGLNNLDAPTPESLIVSYQALFNAIHLKFPIAHIFILSITPVIDKNTQVFVNSVNVLLERTFTRNSLYPFVTYLYVNKFFYSSSGDLDYSVLVGKVHFQLRGYMYFEAGIKDALCRAGVICSSAPPTALVTSSRPSIKPSTKPISPTSRPSIKPSRSTNVPSTHPSKSTI